MLNISRLPVLILLSLLICSCQPAEDQKAATEDQEAAKAFFVAKPQPVAEQEVPPLEIGAPAPDFRLPGADGKFYSLDDFKEADVLCILFTCNHCPTAQAYEERIKQVTTDYQDKGVAMVAISPNSPISLLHEECGYTDLHDDFDHMVIRARDHHFNFPYLYDGDDEAVSIKYGPVATPQAFVFDRDRKLQYRGRIDASEKPGSANAEDLRTALDAVLAGKPVAGATTKTFGCSTKWAWKTEYKERVQQEWENKPVTVEEVDVEGVKALLKNEDSDKLRLINIWATWCGPCIIEYPDLLILQRMYGARDFEFVSLSADKPSQKDKVLKFLEDKESGIKNYLFSKEDTYALIEAVDPEWNGALPYSILVEPGGKIVFSHQGAVDLLELKRAIVEHEMIGRYY